MMLYSLDIVHIAPNVVYYANNDLLMLVSSISTPFALNFG
jgi:hypothetical protein